MSRVPGMLLTMFSSPREARSVNEVSVVPERRQQTGPKSVVEMGRKASISLPEHDGILAPRKGSSASHPYESLQRDGNEYGPHEVSCNELQCLTEVPGNRHAKWKAGGELSRRRAA